MPANRSSLEEFAAAALDFLCVQLPTRTVGTAGNRRAAIYVEEQLAACGWQTHRQPFTCLDWQAAGATLSAGGAAYAVQPGPFSPACAVEGELIACATVEAIEQATLAGRLLLLHGSVAAEQLFPKHYPFFVLEEHQRIYAAVEAAGRGAPLAVTAATGKHAGMAGGIYPFPLFEDGDFDLPAAFMTDLEGARLLADLAATPARVWLEVDATRRSAPGWNVIARKGRDFAHPIVLCAHVDTKPNTPGALDNAAGVVTLLLLARLLDNYDLAQGIELVIFNGEDYYAASGEVAYLHAAGAAFSATRLGINVDGAGYRDHYSAFSLYNCPPPLAAAIRSALARWPGLAEGEPWYQSDHALFVQANLPALAFTTSDFEAVWARIAHTPADDVAGVDTSQLAANARALRDLLRALA